MFMPELALQNRKQAALSTAAVGNPALIGRVCRSTDESTASLMLNVRNSGIAIRQGCCGDDQHRSGEARGNPPTKNTGTGFPFVLTLAA
jgi:hypothetical protein